MNATLNLKARTVVFVLSSILFVTILWFGRTSMPTVLPNMLPVEKLGVPSQDPNGQMLDMDVTNFQLPNTTYGATPSNSTYMPTVLPNMLPVEKLGVPSQDPNGQMLDVTNFQLPNTTYGATPSNSTYKVLALKNISEMNMPFPGHAFTIEKIAGEQWTRDLRDFLEKTASWSVPVTIVTSNLLYQSVLINWLITAEVNLGDLANNILIVSLDLQLHEFLHAHGFNSIFVSTGSVIRNPSMPLPTKIFATRVVVIRMINYLGFDVLHFDNDAIVLKNPLPLLIQSNSSNIVGSTATYPPDMYKKWGFTICMGFIFFRSTSQTEEFWRVYSTMTDQDDQARINHALGKLDIKWDSSEIMQRSSNGIGAGGFKITALSLNHVCRSRFCNEDTMSKYYVWHKGGDKLNLDAKRKGAGSVWLLVDDWQNITERTSLKGIEWLKAITKP